MAKKAKAKDFSLLISRFVEKQKADHQLIIRKLITDIFTRIVLRSPVDTGRFRANWYPLRSGFSKNKNPEMKDKTGNASIERINGIVASAVAGDTYTLTNNLPYAVALEYGHSGQAPNGMVRVTTAEFRTMLKKAVRSRK